MSPRRHRAYRGSSGWSSPRSPPSRGRPAAAPGRGGAAPRVSVVASIGYCAFLGGPPLVGFLGDHITVQKGLISVAVLLGVALLVAGALKPRAADGRGEPRAVPEDDPVH